MTFLSESMYAWQSGNFPDYPTNDLVLDVLQACWLWRGRRSWLDRGTSKLMLGRGKKYSMAWLASALFIWRAMNGLDHY